MKKISSRISISPKVERPFPDKKILWSSQEGGMTRFPESREAWGRKCSGSPTPLKEFGDAVASAQERVWIIDDYLFKPDKGDITSRIEQILGWLPLFIAASDIRILTRKAQGINENELKKFQQRAIDINNHSSRRGKLCDIRIRLHLSDRSCGFIHDRFAIVDDELWHFGATVGGLHAHVSATSRGWRAADHGALAFFEEVWNLGERE